MRVAIAVKAKKLRVGDLVVEHSDGFPINLRKITRIDEPGYGSTGYEIYCEEHSTYLQPNARVMVMR